MSRVAIGGGSRFGLWSVGGGRVIGGRIRLWSVRVGAGRTSRVGLEEGVFAALSVASDGARDGGRETSKARMMSAWRTPRHAAARRQAARRFLIAAPVARSKPSDNPVSSPFRSRTKALLLGAPLHGIPVDLPRVLHVRKARLAQRCAVVLASRARISMGSTWPPAPAPQPAACSAYAAPAAMRPARSRESRRPPARHARRWRRHADRRDRGLGVAPRRRGGRGAFESRSRWDRPARAARAARAAARPRPRHRARTPPSRSVQRVLRGYRGIPPGRRKRRDGDPRTPISPITAGRGARRPPETGAARRPAPTLIGCSAVPEAVSCRHAPAAGDRSIGSTRA